VLSVYYTSSARSSRSVEGMKRIAGRTNVIRIDQMSV
jgi:hypothetical protein